MRTIWHWLRRLGERLGLPDDPDPAWRPTGYTYTHTGHDEARGVEAAKRSEAFIEARRKLAARRAAGGRRDA